MYSMHSVVGMVLRYLRVLQAADWRRIMKDTKWEKEGIQYEMLSDTGVWTKWGLIRCETRNVGRDQILIQDLINCFKACGLWEIGKQNSQWFKHPDYGAQIPGFNFQLCCFYSACAHAHMCAHIHTLVM